MAFTTGALDRAYFWDRLRVNSLGLDAVEAGGASAVAGGAAPFVRRGWPLWGSPVTVSDSDLEDADAVRALVGAVHRSGALFWMGPRYRAGAAWGSIAPGQVVEVSADLGAVRLAGLPTVGPVLSSGSGAIPKPPAPGGAQLAIGDWLSYVTADGRAMLHQVIGGAAVGADGVTGWIGITPRAAPSGVVGVGVVLDRPQMVARIVAGSLKPSVAVPGRASGLAFDVVQVI